MGAYSNPQEVTGVSNAQSYQNLQSTITQNIAGVAQSYAVKQEKMRTELEANKKQLLANQLAVDDESLKLYSDIGKASEGKREVDFNTTFDPLVKEYGNINMSLQTGSSKDRSSDLKRMAAIRNSISATQKDVVALGSYGEAFEKNSANIGNMGGLSGSNDPTMVMAMKVLTGKAKGTTSLKVDPNNPSIRTWTINGELNGKSFTQSIDGNQLDGMAQNNSGPFVYIPNPLDGMDQNKLNSGAYNVDEKPDSKGNNIRTLGSVNDSYLGKEVLIDSPDRITGKTVKQVYRQVDKEKIKPLLAIEANKQAAGMLSDSRSAAAWYNEIYAIKKKGVDLVTASNLNTAEGKQKFQEGYLQYMLDTIPDKQPVMTPDNNIATVTTVAAKPTKVGGKDIFKMSAADKKQAKLDADILDIATKGTGSVQGTGGNSLRLIDGRWAAVDKSGDMIPGSENITDPTTLGTFIGGSRSLIDVNKK
jgi:hypothetical protein